MLLFKLFIACGVIAVGALSVEAADMELQLVDKNCWVEIFEDDNYDANDPHVKIQGPKEVSTMKNLEGKDWANASSLVPAPQSMPMKTKISKAQ